MSPNMRRVCRRLVLSLGLVLLLGLAAAPPTLAGDAYFRGTDLPLANPDWMAELPDSLLLSRLSLPGTHDSLARDFGAMATCQDVPLVDQLQAGIRVLDIRCKNDYSAARGDYFSLWHAIYRVPDLDFDGVADICKAFLAAHPGETIVMRIREENLPNPKCTRSFTDTFVWYRDVKYPGLFADAGDGGTIPTLGAVRGKVVVLQDYDFAPPWGLRYITPGSHPPFDSQDNVTVDFSKAGFDAKWSAIYRHLYAANAGDRTRTWYVNMLSGSTPTDPYQLAGGTTSADGFSATGMNDRMLAQLRSSAALNPPAGSGSGKVALGCTGTLLIDFPGPGLIQAVIALNGGSPPGFTDVAGSPYATAIDELADRGIVTGFQDGTFRPGAAVSRQQFAKMIVKTLGLTVTGAEVCPFTDVAAGVGDDPFYPDKYVAVCAAQGITQGKTVTLFDPYASILRQQLISMVVRAAGLPDPPEDYAPGFSPGQFYPEEHYLNARKAAHAGLLDGLQVIGPAYDFFAPSTRGECAQLLYNLLLRQ